ncbi:MAG: LysM peptidoglycan-binding domain-containing protein [Maricaulaceae bacterium]
MAKLSLIAPIGGALALVVGAATYITLDRASAPTTRTEAPRETAPQPEPEPPRELAQPDFDLVRADPRGSLVAAGRGEPGARIVLQDQSGVLEETAVEPSGEWVIIRSEPLSPGARELTVLQQVEGQDPQVSVQSVLVVIPEREDARATVVLGKPGGPSTVLQSPFEDQDIGPLRLETVDYDDAGGVIFSGQAAPTARVRVLANEAVLGETRADDEGRWAVVAGATLPAGVYDLQVDQIDADGRVSAVIALPFEREAPGEIALGPDRVVVQPGDSLWRMARRLYGEGVQYTVLYGANQSQIRDPNLIYPGQSFVAPGAEAAQDG